MSDARQSLLSDNTKLVITLGFGAVLALMFALVFIAVTHLQSVNLNISRLVDETYVKTEAAHRMREAIYLRASTLAAMQLATDSFKRDQLFMQLPVYARKYREAREQLLSKTMSNPEQQLHARLTHVTQEAQPATQHAAELLTTLPLAPATFAAVAEATERQNTLLRTLDELVALEGVNADEARNQSRLQYAEARNTLFALAAITLLLGVLIALVVIRQASARTRQITYHASHDTLTGLVNRHELEYRVQQAILSARGTGVRHALLYIDLDQFKLINDSCGHLAGDELLRQLTALLKQIRRQSDAFGRLGSDEFALLLENCPLNKAGQIAESIRKKIESFLFFWDGKTFNVSASIGVVPIDDSDKPLEQIMSTADTACYMAKQAGRNRVHAASHGDREIVNFRSEVEIASRIRESLQHNRFELHGQVIVPTRAPRHTTQHIEILVRMTDGHGGLVPPGDFIPAAERYNLMPAIDRWVVEHAISWLADQAWKLDVPTLMINLSGQSLCDDKFLRFVLAAVRETRVPADKICFEITETAVVSNLVRAREFIDRLKQLGCSFALDDFGSGFSSFSYLKNLPVDYLKIDGAFVKDIAENPIDLAIVRAINEIGQVLSKKTIAEFVENNCTLETLRTIGVDYAQGYGISRPQPLDRLGSIVTLPLREGQLAGT
jgi:diguanylate cyclase (GGDEF)-like protein